MSTIPIFAFSTGNKADLASNAYLAGSTFTFYWSQLEPQKGQYAWKVIDDALAPWIANGKQGILRVSTAGWTNWQPPDSKQGTPSWVYSAGVKSVKESDGSLKPQYWNPVFIQHYSDFIKAFAARYDGNASVALIEVAVGDGGETKPDTSKNPKRLSLWKKIGYTDQLWWSAIQKIISAYKAAFTKTPLAVMPDASFIGNTKGFNESLVLGFAAAHGLWLQDNGLIKNEVFKDPAWKKTIVIAEQRNATNKSGDTLAQDLATAIGYGAKFALVFASDINAANEPTLKQYAAVPTQPTTPAKQC